MFKVIDLTPEGKPQERVGTDRVAPPPTGTARWIDLTGVDAEALELLGQRFGFHPLALEDCASFELYSKIEEYDDFLFVALHAFTGRSGDPADIDIHEVHAFVQPDVIVTVHDQDVPAVSEAWRRCLNDPGFLARGPCWALHQTADLLVDGVFPLLNAIANELEDAGFAVIEAGDG